MNVNRRAAMLAAGLAAVCADTQAADAAATGFAPERPLRMVVGLPAGGSTDILARIVAGGLADALGRNVVVDNRVGRSGIVGAERVAKQAAADGHTLLFQASFFSEVLARVEGSLPYDPLRDLAPVGLATRIPNVLVIHPQVPAKSVQELIAHARARQKPLAFASSGSGSSAHLSMELLKQRAGIAALHVPYKGVPQALVDLMSGQVELMFGNIPGQLPHVRTGKLRALAVTSATRSFQLPDLPTMREAGVRDFEITVWFGLMVPAKTPARAIDALYAGLVKALGRPEVEARMLEQGAKPQPLAPADFAGFLRAETDLWVPLVRGLGLKSE